MALRTFNDDYFVTRIAPFVTGCPTPTIAATVKQIVADFFRDTGVYQYEHAGITLSAATRQYALTLPAGTVAERLVALPPLGPLPAAARLSLGQLVFDYDPPDGVVVTPVLALGVAPTATTVDDKYTDRWLDYIVFGCLRELMRIPDREWTDITRGQENAQRYRRGKQAARNALDARYTVANTQMTGPKFV